MIYLRGHPKDYDNWANITGDDGWNFENIVKHYKSIENYVGRDDAGKLIILLWKKMYMGDWLSIKWDVKFLEFAHGHEGEVQVGLPPFGGMRELFVRAGLEMGYPRKDLAGYYDSGTKS